MVARKPIQCVAKEFSGPLRVPTDTRRIAFMDLHGGGSGLAGA
jgi:hypothetical protein